MTSLTNYSYSVLDWIKKKRERKKEKCLHGQWLVKTEKRDKDSPNGGGWGQQRQWQADKQQKEEVVKNKKNLRYLKSPGWDSEGDKKRKGRNTISTAGNWRGWRNGGWRLREGKEEQRERQKIKGEMEHKKRSETWKTKEHQKWKLEALSASRGSHFSVSLTSVPAS